MNGSDDTQSRLQALEERISTLTAAILRTNASLDLPSEGRGGPLPTRSASIIPMCPWQIQSRWTAFRRRRPRITPMYRAARPIPVPGRAKAQ